MKTVSQAMENMYLDCVQCGNTFELSELEIKRYSTKGFDLPLRCPECRKHKSRATAKFQRHPNKKRDYRLKYSQESTESKTV